MDHFESEIIKKIDTKNPDLNLVIKKVISTLTDYESFKSFNVCIIENDDDIAYERAFDNLEEAQNKIKEILDITVESFVKKLKEE